MVRSRAMGNSRGLSSVVALLSLSCAPKLASNPPGESSAAARADERDAPSKVEPAHEAGPRYVMLSDGATLAAGLDPGADTARASDSQSDAPGLLRRFWILRKLATHGAWLEVETVETKDEGFHQCAPALPGLDGYALRLYVRSEETAAVTQREVSVTLPSGNRVTLSPGVRVTPPPREGEPAIAWVDPPLPLAIPPEAIAHDYATPRRYDEGESVGRVGRDALHLTSEIELPERLGWTVLARKVEGPLTVITVADPCVRYELQVPTAAVEEPGTLGYGSGSGRGRAPRFSISAGAPIYWPNGERAGQTRYEVKRSDDPARSEVGRVCFAHAVASGLDGRDPTLLLCFDEFDVHPLGGAATSPAKSPA